MIRSLLLLLLVIEIGLMTTAPRTGGALVAQTTGAGVRANHTTAIVLGVGTPSITAERSGTSIGIVNGGWLYLFDAGAGVERRIFEAGKELVASGVKELGPVFITHLHVDHTIGLAALYRYHDFDPSDPSRVLRVNGNKTLTVYGPSGIRELMDHLAAAFSPRAPGAAGGPGAEPQVQTNAVPRDGGEIYRDPQVIVTAFGVIHKGDGPWYGYRIQTPDRLIVISGDTRPTDAIVEACNGCDILFHEVFGVAFGPQGPVGGGQAGHTSAAELGEIARRANPKLLVLYHQAFGYSKDDLISEIGKSFKGKVVYARDLDVF
jgi:ribonuclease BN (tRNA processing enzyme)